MSSFHNKTHLQREIHNPLTALTYIVQRIRMKEKLCDILNNDNMFLIQGQGLLTGGPAITFLQEHQGKWLYYVSQEQKAYILTYSQVYSQWQQKNWNKLCSSIPVNLLRNNKGTWLSHGFYHTCDLLHSPNTRNVILLCGDTSWQYHSRCFESYAFFCPDLNAKLHLFQVSR